MYYYFYYLVLFNVLFLFKVTRYINHLGFIFDFNIFIRLTLFVYLFLKFNLKVFIFNTIVNLVIIIIISYFKVIMLVHYLIHLFNVFCCLKFRNFQFLIFKIILIWLYFVIFSFSISCLISVLINWSVLFSRLSYYWVVKFTFYNPH